MDRAAQLDRLINGLKTLLVVLAHDHKCQWKAHFARCLIEAESLRSSGFNQELLNGLSGSIRYVYGGMGSFNDYVPMELDNQSRDWKAIPGMDALSEVSDEVYDAALELMVIGRY